MNTIDLVTPDFQCNLLKETSNPGLNKKDPFKSFT